MTTGGQITEIVIDGKVFDASGGSKIIPCESVKTKYSDTIRALNNYVRVCRLRDELGLDR